MRGSLTSKKVLLLWPQTRCIVFIVGEILDWYSLTLLVRPTQLALDIKGLCFINFNNKWIKNNRETEKNNCCIERVREWERQRVRERAREWERERMRQKGFESVREWESERVREWESERVREWEEWESERVREWESERVREWESERVREWESERVRERLSKRDIIA